MADDLHAEQTPGFKVGEKKTIDEYQKLGKDEPSHGGRQSKGLDVRHHELRVPDRNGWKASLGLGTGESIADKNDPRTCIIKSLSLLVDGRPDITIDLSQPGALETLKQKPFIIKEGATYRMKATFVVQHEVLSGLKYIQQNKRKGISVGTDQEMIGSYPPNTTDRPLHSKTFAPEEAPSGMLVRGKYDAVSKFVDDDKKTHLTFAWAFEIAKDWGKQ